MPFWFSRNCSFHILLVLRLKGVNKGRVHLYTAVGVQWEPLFSQSFLLMELLTFTRKSLQNIGEKKVRDDDQEEVTMN